MEQVTSLDGTSIAYWRSGAGKPLVCVHGATADHQSWRLVSPLLEPHVTVIAMDRRGRGGSGDAPGYDAAREAEDIAAVAEATAASGQVAVLGHSFGALCALEAALLTDRIARLVLYEPVGVASYSRGDLDQLQALIDAGALEEAMVWFLHGIVGMAEEDLAAYRQSAVWQQRIAYAPTIPRELTTDLAYRVDAEKFASLKARVVILLGGYSPAPIHAATERLHAALPNSRLVVLPGQEHIAHLNDPEGFARAVLDALTV